MDKSVHDPMNMDAVIAVVDLGKRAGASMFGIGWECPHSDELSDEQIKTHQCPDVVWWAGIQYNDEEFATPPCPDPLTAADFLAKSLLRSAQCKCGRLATPTTPVDGMCTWRRIGDRWDSGCDDPPIDLPDGTRGNLAMLRELSQGNDT